MNFDLRKLVLFTLSSTFYLLPINSNAKEQSELKVYDLAPLLISGEAYAFGAQKLIMVTGEDLEKRQAFDLKDIFSQDPSVMVGGGFGPAQKIYVRGIEDKLLNVSIDGATQAGYLSHHQGQYSIEPELIKLVEAEPGAGAATAGPGALAGSIRFETKGADDFLVGDKQGGSFWKGGYSSSDDSIKGTAVVFGRMSENLNALASLSYSDSDDYESGNGNIVDYTGNKTKRGLLKLDGNTGGRHNYGFTYETRSQKGTFRHRPNFAGFFNHPVAPNIPVDMEFQRDTAIFDYGFTPAEKDYEGAAKIYYTDNSIDRTGQYEMGYQSTGIDLTGKTRVEDHVTAFGLNYRDDSAYFTGKGQAQGFLPFPLVYNTIPDETIEIIGVFAQDSWQVSDTTQISYGLRFDDYNYEDKDGKKYSDNGLSPNAGVSFAVAKNFDINISYGQSFRGVTPIDLITANEGGVENAENIDPEKASNGEFGFQYDNGRFFANGTYYEQEIKDIIIADGSIRDNMGTLDVSGYDFAVGLREGNFTSSLGVSHSKPELNGNALVDTDFGLGSSFGRAWNANAEYLLPEKQVSFGWTMLILESYRESPNPLANKPGYDIHNFYAHWVTGPNGNVVVTLTVNNAFDIFYVDQASSGYNGQLQRVAGLPERGRDVRLSTSIQF